MLRKYKIGLAIAVLLIVFSNCTLNTNQPFDPVQKSKDINFFVKTATSIALHETQPSLIDVKLIKSYLNASQNLLNENNSSFQQLRELIPHILPDKYRVLGLTILDVIERYVNTYIQNSEGDATIRNQLIRAGLEGAITAIDEYTPLESQ